MVFFQGWPKFFELVILDNNRPEIQHYVPNPKAAERAWAGCPTPQGLRGLADGTQLAPSVLGPATVGGGTVDYLME